MLIYQSEQLFQITFIKQSLLISDPYEQTLLYVGPSKVEKAGRGVYTRKPLKEGTLVSFYNGIKMSFVESSIKSKDKTRHYVIDNDWSVANQEIDIPPRYR